MAEKDAGHPPADATGTSSLDPSPISINGEGPGPGPTQAVFDDTEALSRVSTGPPYSAFSPRTRIWITIMVTFASFISPMTANIYFPALNPIATDLGVSTSLVNLTLTTFMILQGLSPTFFGDFGDVAGRRPAYIVALVIYICANIGLALQRNYAALMVLRCVQSAGSSGTLALGYAVIADIATTAERGRYMGIVGAGVNIGPALGPVLGGVLSQYLGWPALFWFCAIFAFVWLIPYIIFVPETCRKVVGNGSIPPQTWNLTLLDYIRLRHAEKGEKTTPNQKLRFPNPLRTLALVLDKETALLLLIITMIYLGFILVAATLSTIFKDIYGYNDLEIGLCYLPYGFGAFLAVVGQGYILDWNYRRIAKKMGITIDRRRGDDLSKFPIESARIQPLYPALLLGAGAMIGYGWTLHYETSVAAPLIFIFLVGMFVTTSFNVLGILLVDNHPDAPATATAATNLVRCMFGAVATAIIDHMLSGMGRGWCFTFLAFLIIACFPGLRVLERCGPRWRAERAKKASESG